MKLQFILFLFWALLTPVDAWSTSQFSKKYDVPCRACHSAFPRLNYYGQRFMRNGYQDPDDENADGSILKKKHLNSGTVVENINHWLGARLNLTPIRHKVKGIIIDGEEEDQLEVGNANWIQLFVAGSIYKDTSIFIEMQFNEKEFHYSWFKLGYHNLFDTSLVNFTVGGVSPRDFSAYPNRLRIMGPIKGDIFGVKSSQGSKVNDEGALNSSGYRPGIQYYGYEGPFLVWAGISPGKKPSDPNNKKHYWGGLRLEVPESMESEFEGSAISIWNYQGEDSANVNGLDSEGNTTKARYNKFERSSIEAEVRFGEAELMIAYLKGEDDNWNLTPTDKKTVTFSGYSAVAGYMIELDGGKSWYPALMIDKINSTDDPSLERQYVTPSVSYFPMENMRLGIYGRVDQTDDKKHDVQFNIRTMF